MAEVITTLHPENDDTIDLYPNIKKENIPANAIETAKIANEAVTENKLDPALQARLADEVVIVELSGTSGVISESSFNKLVNAEIGIIKIDNELYYKAYIKEMGSPAYPVYHFVILNQYAVNESNNDYLVRKDVAVNSSTRYWVKYTDTKSLTFYNEATETILIDHIDTGDLHSDGAIDTDAGITADTESNIAGVVMDDGDVYANELYLGDGETAVSGKLQNLEETDELSLYNLGEFDSINNVNVGIVTINKHIYISNAECIQGSDNNAGLHRWSIYNLPSVINVSTTNDIYASYIKLKVDGTELTLGSATNVYYATAYNMFAVAPNNTIVFVWATTPKTITIAYGDYQIKVNLLESLNTLDINGNQFLINEWLKTLNLADIRLFEVGAIYDNGTNNNRNDRSRSNYIEILPNTNYFLNWSGTTNVNVFFYDSSKTFISKTVAGSFVTPSTAKYIRFYSGLINVNTQIMLTKSSLNYPFQLFNGRVIHAVDVEPVILWTNPSPNVDFGGQITVSDMSIYKYIVIEYKDDPASDTASKYLKVKYEALKSLYIEHPDGMRLVDFLNSTTIDFDTAVNYIIPVAIYGTNIL